MVVETTTEDAVYYVLRIDSSISTDEIYNLEIKQENGELVAARIISYNPADNTTLNFGSFTGTVSSYSLTGAPIASTDYTDGSGGCPDAVGGSDGSSSGGGYNSGDWEGEDPSGWFSWGCYYIHQSFSNFFYPFTQTIQHTTKSIA